MKPILFIFILFLVLLASCGGTNDAQDSPGVNLSIVDNSNGSPVSSATVNIYYLVSQIPNDTSIHSINYPNPFNSITLFQFQTSVMGLALVEVINSQSGKNVIDTLYYGMLESGMHEISWHIDSINSFKDGFYTYKIKTAEFEQNYEMLYLRFNYFGFNYSDSWVPAKVFTNPSNGKITLKPDDMPFIGRKFRHTAENGMVLGDWMIRDSVSIEVLNDGYNTAYQTVELVQGKKTDVTIRLIKK